MQTLADRELFAPASAAKHFYQFYKGREDLFRITIPFLRVGLENGEACVWVVSRSTGTVEAIEAFEREYDLGRVVRNGQLAIVPAERWYLDRGRFSERKVLARWRKFVEEKSRQGFSACRAVGDTAWLVATDWFRFQVYEKKVHAWLQTDRLDVHFTALCAYPIRQCSLTQTKDVLDHHDTVFLSKL